MIKGQSVRRFDIITDFNVQRLARAKVLYSKNVVVNVQAWIGIGTRPQHQIALYNSYFISSLHSVSVDGGNSVVLYVDVIYLEQDVSRASIKVDIPVQASVPRSSQKV